MAIGFGNLIAMRAVTSSVSPAVCVSSDGARRMSISRVLGGALSPPPELQDAAPRCATGEGAPGRVIAGGTFAQPEAHRALAAALGSALAPSLRPSFEWYLCRGAFFHNDAHYSGVLFGVWCVDGPARELVLPRLGLRIAAAPGDWIVFDPFEPHAVLEPGAATYVRERYLEARPSVFAGFELELNERTRTELGIGEPVEASVELSSRTRVNAETGAIE
jgi:hypothetical protein